MRLTVPHAASASQSAIQCHKQPDAHRCLTSFLIYFGRRQWTYTNSRPKDFALFCFLKWLHFKWQKSSPDDCAALYRGVDEEPEKPPEETVSHTENPAGFLKQLQSLEHCGDCHRHTTYKKKWDAARLTDGRVGLNALKRSLSLMKNPNRSTLSWSRLFAWSLAKTFSPRFFHR